MILRAEDLGKSFGSNEVLKSASFTAEAGTITALMGRNGSGKSTMLKIAIGRVRPDWGRVHFMGDYWARPSLSRMAPLGLFYSDQGAALTPQFSIRAHLDAVARVYEREDAIVDVIEQFALGECLERRPHGLSGGEKQRASLAMATLRRPTCLLMDEPFAGVAPKDRPLIADGLRALRQEGCAVVVSGHDVEDLLMLADEIVWVVAGTTHMLGSPDEARTHAQFQREYLGHGRSC